MKWAQCDKTPSNLDVSSTRAHVIIVIFFSLVFNYLLLYLCLLRPIIVICALDMLLIKASYLLTYLLT